MDLPLAVLSTAVVVLAVCVFVLVRRTRRMQRRLERQSAAIILLASRHADLELPAETESDRPFLRLIQGGLGGIAAMVAIGAAAVGRRVARPIAAGSVLVAGGAVALAFVLPSDGLPQRPSAVGVAPSAAYGGLPGAPASTAASTGPSVAPSGTAASPAASSSPVASVEPVSYVSTTGAAPAATASPAPTPAVPQLPALPLPSLSLPPLPTPSLPVTVTLLPSGTPSATSSACAISLEVPGVIGACVL